MSKANAILPLLAGASMAEGLSERPKTKVKLKPNQILVKFHGGVWDGEEKITTEKKAVSPFNVGHKGGCDVYVRNGFHYHLKKG